MSEWRIFYDDDSTFDSSLGTPMDAPPLGFICAVGFDERGERYIMHGWDFYCWDVESRQWWGMNFAGLLDRLRLNRVHAFKEGRTVTKTRFAEIMQKAHTDPDFPKGRNGAR